MKALANETFTPSDQEGKDEPKTYTIKALNSLQLTEVMSDASDDLKTGKTMRFEDIKRLLRLGLEDPNQINNMPSSHHADVASAILTKALVAEEERKN